MKQIIFLITILLVVVTTTSKAALPMALDSSIQTTTNLKSKNVTAISVKAYKNVTGKKLSFWGRLKFSIAKKLIISKMRKKFDGFDDLLGMGPMGLAAAASMLMGLGGLAFFFFGNDDDGTKYKIGAGIGIALNLLFWATGLYPLLAGLFGLLGFAFA